MDKKFKIGDKVVDIFWGVECEIIGDKLTPYKAATDRDVFPLDGNDFVLRPLILKKKGFTEFLYSMDVHLKLIK